MFYEINNELKEIAYQDISPDTLALGYVSAEELQDCGKKLGFDDETILSSQKANPMFSTGTDVHGKYTFTELRIVNPEGPDDSVAIFIRRNLLLIVDINDEDGSTRDSFFKALKKYPCGRISEERMISCFIESLLSVNSMVPEKIRNELTVMEESVVRGDAGENLSIDLLALKKRILKYCNFYGQIMDVTETLTDNENSILDDGRLIYISNLTKKVARLNDEMVLLSSMADHIQDAYAALMDQRMNNTMKILTILTTVFFPLTIIVGWYGMNFKYMPELSWRFGYLFVTLLSVLIILVFVIIGRRKKWF